MSGRRLTKKQKTTSKLESWRRGGKLATISTGKPLEAPTLGVCHGTLGQFHRGAASGQCQDVHSSNARNACSSARTHRTEFCLPLWESGSQPHQPRPCEYTATQSYLVNSELRKIYEKGWAAVLSNGSSRSHRGQHDAKRHSALASPGIVFQRARGHCCSCTLGSSHRSQTAHPGVWSETKSRQSLLPEKILEARLTEVIERATSTNLSTHVSGEQATAKLYVQKAAQAEGRSLAANNWRHWCQGVPKTWPSSPRDNEPPLCHKVHPEQSDEKARFSPSLHHRNTPPWTCQHAHDNKDSTCCVSSYSSGSGEVSKGRAGVFSAKVPDSSFGRSASGVIAPLTTTWWKSFSSGVQAERKIGETHGKETRWRNWESKNGQTAQRGWPCRWHHTHQHILEPCSVMCKQSVRVPPAWEKSGRMRWDCSRFPSVTVDCYQLKNETYNKHFFFQKKLNSWAPPAFGRVPVPQGITWGRRVPSLNLLKGAWVSARSSPDSRWRRFFERGLQLEKPDRSRIGAFLPRFIQCEIPLSLGISWIPLWIDGTCDLPVHLNALLLGPANYELRITIGLGLFENDREFPCNVLLERQLFCAIFFHALKGIWSSFCSSVLPCRAPWRTHLLDHVVRERESIQFYETFFWIPLFNQEVSASAVHNSLIPIKKTVRTIVLLVLSRTTRNNSTLPNFADHFLRICCRRCSAASRHEVFLDEYDVRSFSQTLEHGDVSASFTTACDIPGHSDVNVLFPRAEWTNLLVAHSRVSPFLVWSASTFFVCVFVFMYKFNRHWHTTLAGWWVHPQVSVLEIVLSRLKQDIFFRFPK